jgi:MoxR-like ATPase
VNAVFPAEAIKQCRSALDKIVCDDKIIEYIVSLVTVTRPVPDEKKGKRRSEDILKYIAFGASPRASLALHRCAKVRALFEGRNFVLPEDVKKAAPAVLRHRLVLSYEAAADGVTSDDLIAKILAVLPLP